MRGSLKVVATFLTLFEEPTTLTTISLFIREGFFLRLRLFTLFIYLPSSVHKYNCDIEYSKLEGIIITSSVTWGTLDMSGARAETT